MKRTMIPQSRTLAVVSRSTLLRLHNIDGLVTDAAGDAGQSFTGTAAGGDGEGRGPGGNAYSGYTGSSRGGDVNNSAGGVTNTADASK